MTLQQIHDIADAITLEYSTIHPSIIIYENDGWFHIQCHARQELDFNQVPENPIFQIGRIVLERMATGKKAFIRVRPEVEAENDIASKKKSIVSRVRFSFKDEAGEWEYTNSDAEIRMGQI